MEDKTKRVLYISLAGLLLGLLLFMFGITISKGSLFVDLLLYYDNRAISMFVLAFI